MNEVGPGFQPAFSRDRARNMLSASQELHGKKFHRSGKPTEGLLMRAFLKPRSFLFLLLLFLVPAASHAQIAVGVSIRIGPPALPVYSQPPIPAEGYLWTPGYWGYGPDGYYWVPGVWVMPPRVGVLWTPGYWGFEGGFYGWHAGYWGPHVGFYGGINYGFGYGGVGFI